MFINGFITICTVMGRKAIKRALLIRAPAFLTSRYRRVMCTCTEDVKNYRESAFQGIRGKGIKKGIPLNPNLFINLKSNTMKNTMQR